jgi:hypothetical protein
MSFKNKNAIVTALLLTGSPAAADGITMPTAATDSGSLRRVCDVAITNTAASLESRAAIAQYCVNIIGRVDKAVTDAAKKAAADK